MTMKFEPAGGQMSPKRKWYHEVGPEMEENRHLANALEALNRPFIWVIQPGSGRPGPPPGFSEGGEPSAENEKDDIPLDFDKRVGRKRYDNTWMGTTTADNAKLIVKHLKIGRMISDDLSQMIKKDDIIKGIESLFADEDVKSRAALLGAKFKHGFPASSVKSLDAFRDFIKQKAVV
ncbi:SCOPOLETIN GLUCOSYLTRANSFERASE-LIKE [Salix purpurea]|uniref:SCOPOLETIN GLUCOSYLTRANSFERASE-LIKE n=1 Tax=Salix purpurea TaxID=77065 RepID=A0A9Q0YVX7_SALPP|nr:SCOPOLETIN GLUCOSYLTRANSFERASE-LIKE [Salix purpurea]